MNQVAQANAAQRAPQLVDRYSQLVAWLKTQGLLTKRRCKPSADEPVGDYWLLFDRAFIQPPAGYGRTKDEAIDRAMRRKK